VVVRAFLFIALYVAGLVAGLLASAVLQRRITRGRRLPLLLEMPAYQRPQARVVGRTAWRAAGRFVKDVGTTILVGSAILWVLLHVPMPARFDRAGDTSHLAPPAAAMQHSVAAGVGRALEPVTRAAGFDWRINIGLVASFGAREFMVGTLGVIFGIEDADDESVDQVATALREARGPAGGPGTPRRTASR
jgi:ferrous iron transport protein B